MDSDVPVLDRPAAAVPPLAVSDVEIQEVGRKLAAGTGPLAVDTERASGYRYDDRAFLIQFRRKGAGTFLVDSAANPEATAALDASINDLTWVLHAAKSDLPCLAHLGLFPQRLIDTELGGRLLGFDKVNLSALTSEFLGLALAKGHGREDWSTRPLPADWLNYAALDVELLIELADGVCSALAEIDHLTWFEEECAAILAQHRKLLGRPLPRPTWRDLKGVGKLKKPNQLVVAEALFKARDEMARRKDISPTKLLSHRAIVAMAERPLRTMNDLFAVEPRLRRRKSEAALWLRVAKDALATPRNTWPKPTVNRAPFAVSAQNWPTKLPEVQRLYDETAAAISTVAEAESISSSLIATVTEIRELVWWMHEYSEQQLNHCAGRSLRRDTKATNAWQKLCCTLPNADEIAARAVAVGKREWQAELIAHSLGSNLLLPGRQPLN